MNKLILTFAKTIKQTASTQLKCEATMGVKPIVCYYFSPKTDFGFNQTKDPFKDF